MQNTDFLGHLIIAMIMLILIIFSTITLINDKKYKKTYDNSTSDWCSLLSEIDFSKEMIINKENAKFSNYIPTNKNYKKIKIKPRYILSTNETIVSMEDMKF